MIVAAAVAGVLLVVVIVIGLRLRATGERATAAEAERDRLKAEGDALRAQLAERDRTVRELTPYRGFVEDAGDWVWATDADGTLTFSNAAGAALLGHEDLEVVRLRTSPMRKIGMPTRPPRAGPGSCAGCTPTAR